MMNLQTQNFYKKVGRSIRHFRERKKLSQLDVAKKAGIPLASFMLIEKGKVRFRLSKFCKIVKALEAKSSQVIPF